MDRLYIKAVPINPSGLPNTQPKDLTLPVPVIVHPAIRGRLSTAHSLKPRASNQSWVRVVRTKSRYPLFPGEKASPFSDDGERYRAYPELGGGGGGEAILEPDVFTVTKESSGVFAILLYSTSQKSTVDTYTYRLYEDGKFVFEYTDVPNQQEDGYGTTGRTITEGSSYGIVLVDESLLSLPGTYRIKVEVKKAGSTSYFTPEKTITIN